MKRDAMVIGTGDNVATALRNLDIGEQAAVGIGQEIISIVVVEPVEYGHKFAIRDIAHGDDILKFTSHLQTIVKKFDSSGQLRLAT